MKCILILSLFILGCAGLGTEPENSTETPAAAPTESALPATAAAAIARPPGSYTPDEVYAKLIPIALESQRKQPRPKNGSEFILGFPTEKPRGDEKGEWISSYVTVYYRNNETIDQITLVTENCNVEAKDLNQAAMNSRIQAFVAQISKALFEVPFVLQDKYFRGLGPMSSQQVRVPIKEDYAPVVDMRLMRGFSKCDGRTGFNYRYDFFMK